MAQSQSQSAVRERQETTLREPRRYKVDIHNDDTTTMDFVEKVLERIFFKSPAEARALMLAAHSEGRATVGRYTYDLARTKVNKATQMARKEGFPLKLTYTPE